MFEQITGPDNVLALHFSSKMTVDDVKRCQAVFEERLKSPGQLGLVCDFSGLSDISIDALAPGSKVDMEFIQHLDKFARFAVVSDKEWPGAVIGMADKFLPGLTVKQFSDTQRAEAMQWAGEAPTAAAPAKTAGASIRMLPTSKDDVLAFEINGTLDADSMGKVIKQMDAELKKHDKVRMLGRIKHLGGINPTVFMQHGLLGMKLAAMSKVERYAIVGAPGWMSKVVDTMNPMFSDIDMRTFNAEHENEAWVWLDARPAHG